MTFWQHLGQLLIDRPPPAWERVFWSFIGFSQGYLVCAVTPVLQDSVVRWYARRQRRRAGKGCGQGNK